MYVSENICTYNIYIYYYIYIYIYIYIKAGNKPTTSGEQFRHQCSPQYMQVACFVMSKSGAPYANFGVKMSTGALLFPTLNYVYIYVYIYIYIYIHIYIYTNTTLKE